MHEKQNKTAELEIYVMETVNSTLKMAENRTSKTEDTQVVLSGDG